MPVRKAARMAARAVARSATPETAIRFGWGRDGECPAEARRRRAGCETGMRGGASGGGRGSASGAGALAPCREARHLAPSKKKGRSLAEAKDRP